ncbi:MAG: hypothetical protein C5B43_03070 [Verrucomicrobia bacterium]|nr:MAG: hypothetical protein C5B43_03070 [Verrucomicrobiota bacterium]
MKRESIQLGSLKRIFQKLDLASDYLEELRDGFLIKDLVDEARDLIALEIKALQPNEKNL